MKKRPINLTEEEHMAKIAVVGAGAIGSLIGGYLTKAGAHVWLVDPWREHVEAMQTRGLLLEEPDGVSTIKVKAIHISEIRRLGKADTVLLSVKSQYTMATLTVVKPLLVKDGCVVSCQNGINEDVISSIVGPSATFGCVIHLGATLIGPGHVKRLRRGGCLVIGEYIGGVTERLKALATLLSVCAETRVTEDLRGERWTKLAENSAGNPLLALTGYTTQELDGNRAATPVRRALVRELILVAEACGVHVKPILGIQPAVWKAPLSVGLAEIERGFSERAKVMVSARSSMSYDMEQGRPMEIDALNGYIVAKGRDVGIETPVNAVVVSMIRDMENGLLKPDPKNLSALAVVVNASVSG